MITDIFEYERKNRLTLCDLMNGNYVAECYYYDKYEDGYFELLPYLAWEYKIEHIATDARVLMVFVEVPDNELQSAKIMEARIEA